MPGCPAGTRTDQETHGRLHRHESWSTLEHLVNPCMRWREERSGGPHGAWDGLGWPSQRTLLTMIASEGVGDFRARRGRGGLLAIRTVVEQARPTGISETTMIVSHTGGQRGDWSWSGEEPPSGTRTPMSGEREGRNQPSAAPGSESPQCQDAGWRQATDTPSKGVRPLGHRCPSLAGREAPRPISRGCFSHRRQSLH